MTRTIIGAAQRVHRALGAGSAESVYENALILELRHAGLEVEYQVPIEVRYRGEVVGFFRCDILVERKVILEIKAVDYVVQAFEVQLVNDLRATEMEVGLPLNFGPKFDVRHRIFTNDRKTNFKSA